MCLLLRNTQTRGRASVPWTFCRTRIFRRSRAILPRLLAIFRPQLLAASRPDGFPRFAFDRLLAIFDALAFIGLGRSKAANFCRRFPQQLTIGASECNNNLSFHRRTYASR